MSEDQHQTDKDDKLEHLDSGKMKGGQCLNRHLALTPEEGKRKSCSYRWQTYRQMVGDKSVYNWAKGEKYDSLVKKGGTIATFATKGFPACYVKRLTAPTEKQWDVGRKSAPIGGGSDRQNFEWKCYHPYWHEAHHIVPNSTLKNAIIDFAKDEKKPDELVRKIRGGLLKEKYNLNEKLNMIMLPLDKEVAKALGLPRHRKTVSHWNHSSYSSHVKGELEKIFEQLAKELVDHKKPKYENLKDRIEDLSEGLYPNIKDSQGASLDEMDETEFELETDD